MITWTEAETEILRKHCGKKATRIIAAMLGKTYHATYQKAERLGLLPQRRRKVRYQAGELRTNSMGYLEVKLTNDKWNALHREVWKREHGSYPPKGKGVGFKDGNKENCALENLELVDIKDQLEKYSLHTLPEELKKVIHLKGRITFMINKREKRCEQ